MPLKSFLQWLQDTWEDATDPLVYPPLQSAARLTLAALLLNIWAFAILLVHTIYVVI